MKIRLKIRCKYAFLMAFYSVVLSVAAQPNVYDQHGKELSTFKTRVPAHLVDVILSRPTHQSITLSILSTQATEAYLHYAPVGQTPVKLSAILMDKGETRHLDLAGLRADTRYTYQLYVKPRGAKVYQQESGSFRTPPATDTGFSFVIQADSHLDENTDTAMYTKSLLNMVGDKPDFLVDLGDTWMCDKYRSDYTAAQQQYIAQRYYFGKVGLTCPVFWTLGNHDGESAQYAKRTSFDLMEWATRMRHTYYANPFPNDFYNGNPEKSSDGRHIENYFSWHWGNTLFIVLDPFRYTRNQRDPWQRTLGLQQYTWLKNTLAQSKAKYKMVFIHNLAGGVDAKGIARGGAEAARFYEWGGLDADSLNKFEQYRPGFDMPIHALLKKYGVNIVFHGHDHLFAHQEFDGITYQLVPQPGAMRYGNTVSAREYGYHSGVVLNMPGYLRVNVSANQLTVQLIQTAINPNNVNKKVAYTYSLTPKN